MRISLFSHSQFEANV
uniref:Uncharacterized protein n=1 Tax=Anguilla anguilla TaxID=7936 RepID=A0A0E9T4L1_ANGAN